MDKHEKIDYVEFPAKDMEATKAFFADVFGWKFIDFSPDYVAISNAGIDGGFFRSELSSSTKNGSALIVFYSKHLEETMAKINKANGSIVKPVFEFPGGRRFHFDDPNGNEFGVWSDHDASGKEIIHS